MEGKRRDSSPIDGLIRAVILPAVATLVLSDLRATGVDQGGSAPASPDLARFTDVAAPSGLTFIHENGASGAFDLPEIMGAGVALFDYDNDGDIDVYLVQGRVASPGGIGAGRETSRLFRNDLRVDGKGLPTLRFTDVTATAGLGLVAQGMGAAVGDYDNDGWLDLLVTTASAEVLYRNRGNGTFVEVTREAGVGGAAWSTGAAFFDYDRDGWLDMFVADYVNVQAGAGVRCQDSSGAPDYCGPQSYRPVPARLYRNLGKGRFADVSTTSGITRAFGNGLGVISGDFNGDGWPDLYVANDATPNQLWINRRDGTFLDQGLRSGTALSAAGSAEGSMGITAGDIDGDGDEDLFVTNLAGETHVLYSNLGGGLFEDARVRVGLGASTRASTGFGTGWIDYDNDGWLDLFIANGGVRIVAAQRGQPRPYRMRNQLFHNAGNGRFADEGARAGADFARAEISRGAAFGDIDNDGDIDIVVTTNGGAVRLLRNDASGGRHWLEIRLDERPGNRLGFGAWVGVERARQPTLWRRVRADGSYLSANDSRLHYGLGSAAASVGVIVRWPDGVEERWTGVGIDRVATLRRGSGTLAR